MKTYCKKALLILTCLMLLSPSVSVKAAGTTADETQTKKVKVGWYISEHFQEEDVSGKQKKGLFL